MGFFLLQKKTTDERTTKAGDPIIYARACIHSHHSELGSLLRTKHIVLLETARFHAAEPWHNFGSPALACLCSSGSLRQCSKERFMQVLALCFVFLFVFLGFPSVTLPSILEALFNVSLLLPVQVLLT